MSSNININLSQSNVVIFAASIVLLVSVIIHLVGIFTPSSSNATKKWLNWVGGIFIIIGIVLLYVAYGTKCYGVSSS
jgi:hypothetical protein